MAAQQADAATLSGREIEACCVASFIFSQPIGEQAELSDLRWLVATTCEMPAVLNNGLIAWARQSWYLEECEATEAGSGVPKFWRLGPKPNLNQLHDSYKRQALKHARSRFDELARTKCTPLYEGWLEEGVRLHKLPPSPSDVEDDGQFRVVLLGADWAGTSGGPPDAKAVEFIRTHSSPSDNRTYQNVVLVVTPSVTGLHHAEQQIAEWMAWEEIEGSTHFKGLESFQQEHVRRRKRDTLKDAQTAVKNSYELVMYIDKDGAAQAKKVTLGAQSLMATLLQESALRLFQKKIDAEAIMPNGLYPVWPAKEPFIGVSELHQEFGRNPKLPRSGPFCMDLPNSDHALVIRAKRLKVGRPKHRAKLERARGNPGSPDLWPVYSSGERRFLTYGRKTTSVTMAPVKLCSPSKGQLSWNLRAK